MDLYVRQPDGKVKCSICSERVVDQNVDKAIHASQHAKGMHLFTGRSPSWALIGTNKRSETK